MESLNRKRKEGRQEGRKEGGEENLSRVKSLCFQEHGRPSVSSGARILSPPNRRLQRPLPFCSLSAEVSARSLNNTTAPPTLL